MKAKIATFSLKGKENIWREYVKHVRGIREEELIWSKFGRLFKRKYLSERYYDERAKDFYELRMVSMTDDDYTRIFLELLRYVPYLDKANIQRFINGLLVSFKDHIEFDDPRSLEEAIRKLKNCYEKSKCKLEFKCD